MKISPTLSLLLLALTTTVPACAEQPHPLQNCFKSVASLEDTTGQMTVTHAEVDSRWQARSDSALDARYTKSAFWFRLSSPIHSEPCYVEAGWKTLNFVGLYGRRAGVTIEQRSAGDEKNRSAWPLRDGDYPAFKIIPRADVVYYLRIRSESFMSFPIRAMSEDEFRGRFERESTVIWLYKGIILVVLCLSILVSIWLREMVYTYYGLYVTTLWTAFDCVFGNAFRVYWPDSPWLTAHGIFFFHSLGLMFAALFFRKAVRLAEFIPKADVIARALILATAVLAAVSLMPLSRRIITQCISLIYFICIPTFLFLVARLILVNRQKPLYLIAVSWGIFYSLGIMQPLAYMGILPAERIYLLAPVLLLPIQLVLFGGGLAQRHQALMAEAAALAAEKADILARLESFGSASRYKTSKLRDIDVDQLLLKLNDLMESQKLYCNEGLALSDVAGLLGVTGHQLSELLNARLNLSFPALILNYRVQEAERLLRAHPEKTILQIALEAGFNSKTTFNVGFKKIKGITPSEFRAG